MVDLGLEAQCAEGTFLVFGSVERESPLVDCNRFDWDQVKTAGLNVGVFTNWNILVITLMPKH